MTKATAPRRERVRLTLEVLPDQVPASIRLRGLLKYALRACRLKCVVFEEVASEDTPASRGAGDQEG